MANKKANRKLSRILISSVFFIFLLLAASPGWADISNAQVVISSDLNGDGVAGIGDTLTISCRSTTTSTTGEFPFVSAPGMGISNLTLPQLAGSLYSAILTVSPGSVDGNVTFTFGDDSNSAPQRIIAVDNRRPSSQYGPTANSGTGNGGVFKLNDPLQIDLILNSAADGDSISANLTALGLSANTIFQANGANAFRLNLTSIPTGKEGTLQTIAVTALDNAGNATTWNTVSVSYDTIAPVIKSVIITNTTANKTYITAGDSIKVQATVSNFDNDTLVASNTSLFGTNPVTLNREAGGVIGGEAVYETIVYVTEANLVQNSFIFFDVTATDDAGNSVKKTSNSLRIDSVPPEFQGDLVMKIFRNSVDITSGNNIARISDSLQISGNVAAGMKDIILTVDLSGIGGVSNQIVPFSDGSSAPNLGTTTFKLDYPVFQYTSENSTPRAFTVTAKDIAGNFITRVTLPIIYVDNLPPTISAGLVQNISRPGQPARYGDQIAITATVGNIDNGSVWVDLRKLGGDASSTLSISGTSYRVDHVVTDSLIGGITDQSMNFVVYAVDDAGNTVQTVTNSLSIDNEPPMFLTATYTVNPVLSTSHPYVRVGDRLTFRAQLASSASSIYDGQTVKAYLNELGQANPVEMTYVGGYYTTSLDVQAGTLNYEHYFSLVATDNSGNEKNAAVQVKIDNSVPDVGPMGVNFLTDMAKTGAINVGDRLEFIIPVNDKDDGYCVLDLSMVGGSATTILNNYDPTLRRYYHVHDCASAPVENPGYVFRAIVYDKAFNTMNSLSNTFEVDCRLPIITSFSTTPQELKGKTGVINTGDKIKFTAFVDLSSLDSAVPTVNLSMLGGTSNQQLYDDGAHGDGGANDGEYSYTHTVVEGTTNGETVTLVLTVTDNAGNRVTMSAPTSYLVDNQSLIITSVTNIQKLDTNGNTIVDLDGKYTDVASFATDTVALKVLITGANNGLPASVTVDLTKFGYSETASTVPCITTPTGFEAEAVIELRRGNTNNEEVKLVVKVTDENGNETVGQAANAVRVDNMPPTIDIYPITFVVDNGRIGEANRGDVIQIKVKMTNHDGILPMIDLTNLYSNNGLTPPNPILFPPNAYGGNEYTYQWTVPEGLGTEEGLVIIALDSSGNMAYARTNSIMFLSKIPQFGDCIADIVENPANANRILNPGETVKFRCVLNSVYNYINTPAAKVVVDIRSITNSNADDAGDYADGNMATYWAELTTFSTSPPYVYEGEFVASASIPGVDTVTANFAVKILHPKTNAITMATSVATANPNSPFGIDTQVPGVKPGSFKMSIVETNGDNTSSSTANIGDILRIQAEFERFADPGSATVSLIQNSTTAEIFRAPMYQLYGSNVWESMITLATGTVLTGPLPDGEWLIVEGTSGRNIRVNIYITDDADNLYASDAPGTPFIPNPAIHLDNNPPVITNGNLAINPNSPVSWVANVGGYDGIGSGFITDGIVGSLTINGGDLTSGGMAYIDLTPIDGTATYRLDSITGNLAQTFTPFYLATDSFDLATRTFRLFARDAAGNRAFIEKELAVDSRRPSVQYANFDGRFLTIGFSEKVRPDLLRSNLASAAVRIGRTQDLADAANPNTFVKLGVDDILFSNLTTDETSALPADGLIIALASGTKKTIADWGKVNLYLSISFGDADDKLFALTTDESGNWLRPVSRVMGNFPINITDDYTIRPNLVSGSFDAVNGEGYLYLNFDKDVDNTSLTADSLTNLAIWYNKGSSAELLANRYRMTSSDTYDPNDEQQLRTLRIKLSDDAQDWIALKYGRLASLVHLSVRDLFPTTFPPPLVRDYEGNKINPILPASAIPATLIPINTTFSIMEQGRLNLIDPANPILTITFERRARLFNDEFTTSKTLPADLSRVYIYEKADTNTGRSISLGSESQTNPMVDWARYKTINTYASTSILIPLSAEALKTMLSWGTSNFFLACSENAFRDLWGNGSQRFPSASNNALPVTIPPGEMPVTNPPTISSLAIRPVVKAEGTLADPFFNIFKIQPADGLIFEVAFDTATLSADVRIPIDRTTSKPTLKVETTTGTVVGLPTRFVGWAEHNQNGVIRTIAQFANLETSPGIDYDGTQVVVKVEGVEDIFDKSLSNNIATTAYDLAAKDLTGSAQNGFIVDRYPIKFDNVGPGVVSATSTSPIGVTGPGNLKVTVVFSEKLDATPSRNPVLRMTPVNSDTTIMNFTLESISGNTAIYTNNGAFDSSITQGECRYRVSGGFDIVGNPGKTFVANEPVFVYSKGPNVKTIKVQTFQSTTAKANYDLLTGAPFSPNVAPGVATITVEFDTLPRDNTGYIQVYATNVNTPIASLTVTGPSWAATWNGRDSSGIIVDGTHELRFYDLSNNEGSRRGTITVDSQPVQVKNWDFPNVKSYNGKAYFSPLVQSAVKMDAYCQIAGSMKMRLVKPGNSTDTYLMTTLSSSGYTVNFDGKSADGVSVPLDGEFEVSLVDLAGNVGTALPGGKATATLVIDRLGPTIRDIQMFRADGNGELEPSGVSTTRFNPRSNYKQLKFFVYEENSFAPMASGTGLIRIMAGSTMLKELVLSQNLTGDPLTALWDGTNKDGQLLTDGKYTVIVTDLAGNPAKQTAVTIDFVSSSFKLTAASQSAPDSLKLVFSHGIASNTIPSLEVVNTEDNSLVLLLGVAVSATANNVVVASFNTPLAHDKTYRVTVTNIDTFSSEDSATMAPGDNVATFKADTKGPQILATNGITYDGITTQKKFNVVFDEQLEPISAATKANYAITGTSTLITDVAVRADLKSVTITTDRDIVEGINYRITVNNVKDLIGNKSSNTYADFTGRDLTPPDLTVTAFSNPANEYDVVIVVKSNEELSGPPTATITQSGASAVSLMLSPGMDSTTFIGGTTINSDYGQPKIKVTAKDMAGNTANKFYDFIVAVVTTSVRASLSSTDNVIEAVFEPGTLSEDSLVMIVPEDLKKTAKASARGSRIMPGALVGMDQSQLKSLRASIPANDRAAEELEPVAHGYSLIIPAGRLKGSVAMSMKLEEQTGGSAGVYYNDGSGWKAVKTVIENGVARFSAASAGTFALMRDIEAPRANMLNDITSAPVRESRPVFTWSIEEFASGIAPETAMAVLDGRKYPVMLDEATTVARFAATDDLVSGEHSISLQIADKAGNLNVLPALRFVALPALKIHEVVQFPNPARNRVSLRISTNRNEVDAEEIRVKIYDTAGHLVAATNDLVFPFAKPNGAGKVVQDVVWDLRNKDGKAVANGVYFAKIEVRDPDNYEKKTRYTHKIAVLR